MRGALLDNADLFFPYLGTFTKGAAVWQVHFSVSDPEKVSRVAIAGAQASAESFNVPYRDVRLLKIQPGELRPVIGAQLTQYVFNGETSTHWDGGVLEILAWSQAGKLSGQKVGTCVLRR